MQERRRGRKEESQVKMNSMRKSGDGVMKRVCGEEGIKVEKEGRKQRMKKEPWEEKGKWGEEIS